MLAPFWSVQFTIILLMLTCARGFSSENDSGFTPELADAILKDEPLTIVFRKVIEEIRFDGKPNGWCWSFNSAGQAELTIELSPNLPMLTAKQKERKKLELPPKKMDEIRQVLRDAQFFHLKDDFGPHVVHGGWDTLTVVAGEHAKTIRFHSVGNWPEKGKKSLSEKSIPAARVWLKMVEVVDPEGKIFAEKASVAKSLRELKK